MAFLLLILGFSLFLLALGYLFSPRLILRFNAIMRDSFFKDSVVLLSHRRMGLILLFISSVIIALAFHGHTRP